MTLVVKNLLDNIAQLSNEEFFETLYQTPKVRIERIVSKGNCSAPDFWYDQHWDEWILILQGQAKLELKGQPNLSLNVGDSLLITAHTRHRVQWTDPTQETIWLAVHILDEAQHTSQDTQEVST